MKKVLRGIAVILLIVMQFTTNIVFAGDTNFQEEFIAQLGIIEMDENYNSEALVTRIEFVKAILKMKRIDTEQIAVGDMQPFFDVTEKDEFFNAANVAYSLGIIKGGTDGCFRPYDAISKEAAATIVLRALGGEGFIEAAGGVESLAMSLGLYKNLSTSGGSDCTYSDAAVLIYNALTAKGVEKQANGTYRLNEDSTLLGNLFEMKYASGVLDGNYKSTIYGETPTEYNYITVDGVEYKLESEIYNDLYFGHSVTVYYTENPSDEKVVTYIEENKNSVLELDFEDLAYLNPEEIGYVNSEKNKVTTESISRTCVVLHNNSKINLTDSFDISGNGNVICIDNNKDGYIDILDIKTYDIYLVKNAGTVYNRLAFENSDALIELDDYDYCRIVDVNGNNLTVGDIAQYNVAEVSISEDKKYITVTVVTESLSITVSQVMRKISDDYAVIKADDGVEYRTVKGFDETLEPGVEYTFALDSKGKICFEITSDEERHYKLGYVMGISTGNNPLSDEGKIKIIGTDEKVYTLTVPEKVKCLNYNEKISVASAMEKMEASRVIRFAEKDGVITAFEFASEDESYDGLQKIASLPNSNSVDSQFWKPAALIGGKIPLDNNTMIINQNTSKNPTDEKAYSFMTMTDMVNEQYYPSAIGYRIGNDDVYSDIVVMSNEAAVTKDSPVMLISSVSQIYDAESGEMKIAIEGFVSGSVKEFKLKENELLIYTTKGGAEIELGAGDCIRYVINQKNEISQIKLMFDYSEMKLYGVDDGDDLNYSYGERQLHRTGQVKSVHGNYVKLVVDGISAQEDYLYSLNAAGVYQVSRINGRIVCEAIMIDDIVSLKNDSGLTDRVFTYLVYGNTKLFVVYKG